MHRAAARTADAFRKRGAEPAELAQLREQFERVGFGQIPARRMRRDLALDEDAHRVAKLALVIGEQNVVHAGAPRKRGGRLSRKAATPSRWS